MPDVLFVGESKRTGNHSVFAGWEQEQQEAALDIELRAWDCLGQLIKHSVSPYTAARLTLSWEESQNTFCKAMLLNIPQSRCLPHQLFQVPLFTCWYMGVDVCSEKQQAAKSPGHPLFSCYIAKCS